MSYLRSNEYSLYLGGRRTLLRKAVNWPWSRKWVDLAECGTDKLDDVAAHLVGPSARLTVWLAGVHCRWVTFPLSPGMSTDDQLVAVASKLFADRLGLEPGKWKVVVSPLQVGVVAAAAPLALLEALQENLQSQAEIRAVRPWFERVLTGQKIRRPLGLMEEGTVTFTDSQAGSLRISTLIAGQEDIDSFARRVAFQNGSAEQAAFMRMQTKERVSPERLRGDFLDCLSRVELA